MTDLRIDMSGKLGRNDPCHCGSGRKYKKCHLSIDEWAQPVPERQNSEKSEGLIEDDAGLGWDTTRGRFGKNVNVFKFLRQSSLVKSDPELRRILKENEDVLAYMECQQEFESALAKLEPYEEEFARLLDDQEALTQRGEELFGEEPFVPLGFTAADVERAFQKVGYPPNPAPSEDVFKVYLRAILFLASEERRANLVRELMRLVPGYVAKSRFVDACLILFAAQATAEDRDQANPLLMRLFYQGLEGWAGQQAERRRKLLQEVGLPSNEELDPEKIDAWCAEQRADPVKALRMQKLLDANPEMKAQSTVTADMLRRGAVDLLKREDAGCLLLGPDELELWTSFLSQKLQAMRERYGPTKAGVQLSPAQQEEAISAIYLPAMREVATGIFTPERIQKLVGSLKVYRNELFAKGEQIAAFQVMSAISYVEQEDQPGLNVFLVNLCASSIHSIGGSKDVPSEEES